MGKADDGALIAILVLHDDAKNEDGYGLAQGLPDTKVGAFPQALYDQAKKQGWKVIRPFATAELFGSYK